jgi:alpha,alpha-trehalase
MAVWVMERALEIRGLLPPARVAEIAERIGLEPDEVERWRDITRKMTVPFHGDGIISQFEGYDKLEEFDWEAARKKHGDIKRLDRILKAEGDSPDRYKLSKQADVLMLFYLLSMDELSGLLERLGYDCPGDALQRNVDYYIQRTSHGSTLSFNVHSWVLARSDREASWGFFKAALESDISDIQGGTTKEGIHLGAMAGTVDLIQRGYTGLETREDVLRVDPALPSEIESIKLEVRYRGQWVRLEILPEMMTIITDPSEDGAIFVSYGDETFEVPPGATREIPLD